MDLLVGVDLGTTACKVTVVASDLTASSISSPPYPIAAPHREWAEQDPRTWGEAVDTTVQRALDSVGGGSRDHVTLSILPSASSSVPLTPASGNASARGAALLAGVGIGLY
jgi:xylulokinase